MIDKNNMDWKNVKEEIPAEAAHTDMIWCSQNVLARYSWHGRYVYAVCWYDFEGKCFMTSGVSEKYFPATEWCELEIYCK